LTTTIADATINADRQSAVAEARAQLFRRAEAHGIRPITSLDALLGDPEMTVNFDVEEFLRQMREDRNRL
jgi:hypothetical protein